MYTTVLGKLSLLAASQDRLDACIRFIALPFGRDAPSDPSLAALREFWEAGYKAEPGIVLPAVVQEALGLPLDHAEMSLDPLAANRDQSVSQLSFAAEVATTRC